MGVCSDSNRTKRQLQIPVRKSLETISRIILSRLQPKFAAKTVANEKICMKIMHILALLRFSTQRSLKRLFEQCAAENNHLLCYGPTIHNSISNICLKFQILNFWVFTSQTRRIDRDRDEHWAKNVLREIISLRSSVEQMTAVKWFNWDLKICPKFQVLLFSHLWGWWPAR